MNMITNFLKGYPKISIEFYLANSLSKIIDSNYDKILSVADYYEPQVIKIPFFLSAQTIYIC